MERLTCHKEKITVEIKAVRVSLSPAWVLLPEEGPDLRVSFWLFSKNGDEKGFFKPN